MLSAFAFSGRAVTRCSRARNRVCCTRNRSSHDFLYNTPYKLFCFRMEQHQFLPGWRGLEEKNAAIAQKVWEGLLRSGCGQDDARARERPRAERSPIAVDQGAAIRGPAPARQRVMNRDGEPGLCRGNVDGLEACSCLRRKALIGQQAAIGRPGEGAN